MGANSKRYNDFASMLEASDIMDEFQLLHNIFRTDYEELLKVTEQFKNSKVEFDTLCRACLIQLYTLIESDIYGLDRLDPYPKIKSQDNFFNKFTKTFDQIAETFDKKDIWKEYVDNHLTELSSIKSVRNSLVHPKKVSEVFIPTHDEFQRIKTAFNNYNAFMRKMMNSFFIEIDTSKITPEQFDMLMERKKNKGITLGNVEYKATFN